LITDHWLERDSRTRAYLTQRDSRILEERPSLLPEDVLMDSRNLSAIRTLGSEGGGEFPPIRTHLVKPNSYPLPSNDSAVP
jgi:hypothetical protein